MISKVDLGRVIPIGVNLKNGTYHQFYVVLCHKGRGITYLGLT